MTSLGVAFTVTFATMIYSETLTVDNDYSLDIIECKDAFTDCIIYCINNRVCEYKQIHCHRTSTTSICKINLNGAGSARYASIYTHHSPLVYINILDIWGCESCIIYAHEQLGSKLYVYGPGYSGMMHTLLYAPVGEGSLLSIRCGVDACSYLKIYEDWTTEIYMEPLTGRFSFSRMEIKNIFDNSTLNISRSDPNYIALNTAYRASVFLNGCNQKSTYSWSELTYYGHNHGNWILYGAGSYSYHDATIYATADIPMYNEKHEYDIKLIGSAIGNTTDDTLTGDHIFSDLKLYTNGNRGANIYVEVTGTNGFQSSNIYARDANSVNVYCHQGGDCEKSTIECPENHLNSSNSCFVFCDGDPTTNCGLIQMYTVSGYCKDAALLCTNNNCVLDSAKIYCGYDQITNHCRMVKSGTTDKFECINYGTGYCNNNYTEELCRNVITSDPVAISTTFEATCNFTPTTKPTAFSTTYSLGPITASTTTAPSTDPSVVPTLLPAVSPTNPTLSFTIHPTAVPTKKSIFDHELVAPITNPPLNTIQPTSAPTDRRMIKFKDEEEESYDTVLIIAIVVIVVFIAQAVIFRYFVGNRTQRAESTAEEIQIRKKQSTSTTENERQCIQDL